MRKWVIILLIAIIVSSIVAIFFFLFRDKEQDILSKVPANAKSVVLIDLEGLLTKLVIDNLSSDTKAAANLSKMIPDSLADIDLSRSGISSLEKIVLFTIENPNNDTIKLNLIFRISNIEEFESFIDSLTSNKSLDIIKNGTNKTAWSKQYRSIIKWNKHFVVVTKLSNNQQQDEKALNYILSLQKKKSIMVDSSFMKKQAADFDILLYSLPYSRHPKINTQHGQSKHRKFIQSNIKSIVSLIKFNEGELELKTELTAKKESLLEQLFEAPEKELPLLNMSDSFALNSVFNINPKAFFQIIEQYSSVKFDKGKLPYIASWNGRANITLNGIKTIKNEFISYDYDDDFNKIEIKKTVEDEIWDIQAIFGTDKTTLDSVFKKAKLHKSRWDTLLFKGSNFVLKKTGSDYLCYNKHVSRPNVIEKVQSENVSTELNYKYFVPLLKGISINKDSVQLSNFEFEKFKLTIIKKEQINIFSSFYFADKEKNSFFSITEKFVEDYNKPNESNSP